MINRKNFLVVLTVKDKCIKYHISSEDIHSALTEITYYIQSGQIKVDNIADVEIQSITNITV